MSNPILGKGIVFFFLVCYTVYIHGANVRPHVYIYSRRTEDTLMSKSSNPSAGSRSKPATSTLPTNAVSDFLARMDYTPKHRGGVGGDGKTCTMAKKQNRFTLPATYVKQGYRSGAVGLIDGKPTVLLSKNLYTRDLTSLHQDQNFLTIPSGNTLDLLRKHYNYTIASEEETKAGLVLHLEPVKA